MEKNINQLIKAAANGNPKAQYLLAVSYHTGRNGIKQDYEQAAVWYLKAAEQGHEKAAFYLGTLYQNGYGVKQSYDDAAICYEESAASGNDEAKLRLGILYAEGLGVPKDIVRAKALFQQAAENGNEKALAMLDKLPDEKNIFPLSERFRSKGIIALLCSILASVIFFLAWSYRPSRKMEVNEIVSMVIPATVFISAETDKGRATGSGFFALDGKIFTNAHVVDGAKSISIRTHNGNTYEAEVLDKNQNLDLAVLTANVNKSDYTNLSFADSIPAHGDGVVVIGSPLGYEQTVSNGLVSAVRNYDNDLTILQITAPISPGSSGSPAVNMQGEVIGVATMTNRQGQNINFAVSPLSARRKFSGSVTYIVESGVPVANDDKDKLMLRVGKNYLGSSAKSPANDKVKVIAAENLEVRTIAKVQSVLNGKTYWIDSSSVVRPVEISLHEFVRRFNDSTAGFSAIKENDFTVKDDTAFIIGSNNSVLSLKLDNKSRNIKEAGVIISKADMKAGEIHPWIRQTINVFYPIPVISHTDFYKGLLNYKIGPAVFGLVRKFPISFLMSYGADSSFLSVKFGNDNPEQVRDTKPVSEVREEKQSVPISSNTPQKKKKTSVRDPEYLNEIRVAFRNMKDISKDDFSGVYIYRPQKYSSFTSWLTFEPRVGHIREEGFVDLSISIGFENSRWVFADKIIFNCDGKNFTLNLGEHAQRDAIYGGIYERYVLRTLNSLNGIPVATEYLTVYEAENIIEHIISSKTTRVRFSGSRRVADRTLSKKDIQNLAKCYECYKNLTALEGRWEN